MFCGRERFYFQLCLVLVWVDEQFRKKNLVGWVNICCVFSFFSVNIIYFIVILQFYFFGGSLYIIFFLVIDDGDDDKDNKKIV